MLTPEEVAQVGAHPWEELQAANRRPHSSMYIGVGWREKLRKWTATVVFQGSKVHLGVFEDDTEAAHAVDKALLIIHDRSVRGGCLIS